MISYRDRTFFVSKNCTDKCGRKLTKEIKEKAAEWWGSDEAPISVAKFCEGEENV